MAASTEEIEVDDSLFDDETVAEHGARVEFQQGEIYFNREFVDGLLDKLMVMVDWVSGTELYGYQTPFGRRIMESLVTNDGATLTALFSRQSGKTETVANVLVTAMIMLPRLAKIYPDLLGKFKDGLWVGAFAPTDGQTDILFGRIISRLSSDRAVEILQDPEIADRLVKIPGKVPTFKLKNCGSFISRQTAHPRAKIEGRTYHIILIDECFPEGTPVLTSEGWVPIDEIVNGDRRDWVVATQGADGVEWSRVKTGYRTERRTDLVRVDHEHGSLYATANHPFMVNGEKVPAIHLRPGASLSLVQSTTESSQSNREAVSAVHDDSVQQLAPSVPTELDGRPSHTGADGGNPEEYGASPYYPWGEWEGPDEATGDITARLGKSVAPRACSTVWKSGEGGNSVPLQTGSSTPDEEDRRRDRREISRNAGTASSGSPEDFVVGESRVVSVTVLEPGSPEFDQFGDGADHVYTLEVEHESHTYITAGVVVGNCQEAEEKTVNKCYAEGTPVWMPEGGSLPIEQVVAEKRDVLAFEDGQIHRTTPTEWHDNGLQEVHRVEFASGRVVEVTENHRWMTRSRVGNRQLKWRTTTELLPGMSVPSPKGVDAFGDHGDEAEGYFVGSMLGDGCMTGSSPLWCGFADEATEAMREFAGNLGCSLMLYNIGLSGLMEFGITKPGNKSNAVTTLLKEHQIWGLKGQDKRLIRDDYSAEFYCGWLAGMLDTDGCASGLSISFDNSSERLVRQISDTLLRFGIYAAVSCRSNENGYGAPGSLLWSARVKGVESVRRLADLTESRSKRMQLRAVVTRGARRQSRQSSSDKRRGYSDTVFMDRVKSVIPVGQKKTYCVTVEPSHLFVVNGLVGSNSIAPMGASTHATMVYIGTPTYWKGVFYRQIQLNKRQATRRGTKTDHFEADWKEVARWNKNYELYVKKEMLRTGEDSDEFRLSYRLHWLLDKGMFTTTDILDRLHDTSMEMLHAWNKTPVVVGIDPARKQDSTIVTVVFVDWDRPDDFGFYQHRILAWLDLENQDWETQYHRIVEFLSNYSIFRVGVDEGGLGDVVIDRLRRLMPHLEIIAVGSSKPEQSKRWKHLMQLFSRQSIGWPGHAKTRRLKVWKRFRQQFEDLELHYDGPHVVAAAPKESGAHDDYCDSLALACQMTEDYTAPRVEVMNNPFYSRKR